MDAFQTAERMMEMTDEKTLKKQFLGIKGGEKSRYDFINFGLMPKMYKDLGFGKRDILLTKQHLIKAVFTKHHLSLGNVLKFPEEICDPTLIIDSSHRNEDTIVVVTSLLDKNDMPVILAIKKNTKIHDCERIPDRIDKQKEHRDADGRYYVHTHVLLSAYGKNNIDNYIRMALEENRILYINKEKTDKLFGVLRLQLPEGLNNLSDKHIISHFEKKSNENEKILKENEEEEEISL